MRTALIQALAVIIGYALTTAGLTWVYPPAGLFWAGGCLLAAGLLVDL